MAVPFSGYTTFDSSIHRLMDIWILQISLLWAFIRSFCVYNFYFSWVYSQKLNYWDIKYCYERCFKQNPGLFVKVNAPLWDPHQVLTLLYVVLLFRTHYIFSTLHSPGEEQYKVTDLIISWKCKLAETLWKLGWNFLITLKNCYFSHSVGPTVRTHGGWAITQWACSENLWWAFLSFFSDIWVLKPFSILPVTFLWFWCSSLKCTSFTFWSYVYFFLWLWFLYHVKHH